MESTKVFFDINIVLDIIDPMRSHHSKAKELWKILVTNKSQILISEDMLSTWLEFFSKIMRRGSRLAPPPSSDWYVLLAVGRAGTHMASASSTRRVASEIARGVRASSGSENLGYPLALVRP